MKRKVKKYAGGTLVDSSGNPVRSGSGEPIRTRFGKDDEDRPKSSGAEDYATLGKRAGATSPFSGPKEYISESIKEDTEKETESPKGIASGFKSGESKFERNDKQESIKSTGPSSFKEAFSAAKNAGNKTFEYNGKKYTTEIASSKKTDEASKSPSKQKLGATYSAMYGRLQDSSIPEGAGKEALRKAVDKAKKDYESAPMKKGGAVKKMSSGGKTSSASSRGDGIAQRGKTRGRMC